MLLLLAIACTEPLLERAPLAHESWDHAVQVQPPIALPIPAAEGWVEIWLDAPEPLTVETGPHGAPQFAYPPGTTADRVEFRNTPRGPKVIDVRGTHLDEDGTAWHHVYQPVSRDPEAALVGVRWPAQDVDAEHLEVERFIEGLRNHGRKRLELVRNKLDCRGCHVANRPANTHPNRHGLVSRGTDGAGFFTPSTVLTDEVPAELYGRPEQPARFTSWTCDEPVPVGTRRCADGTLARIHFDQEAALAAGDPHALQVAATRTRLLGGPR